MYNHQGRLFQRVRNARIEPSRASVRARIKAQQRKTVLLNVSETHRLRSTRHRSVGVPSEKTNGGPRRFEQPAAPGQASSCVLHHRKQVGTHPNASRVVALLVELVFCRPVIDREEPTLDHRYRFIILAGAAWYASGASLRSGVRCHSTVRTTWHDHRTVLEYVQLFIFSISLLLLYSYCTRPFFFSFRGAP